MTMRKVLLLYSWRFSHYSAPIHWLVHGHMTSNNETASRQMPWAGNIAKTMMSNGKQFTVTRVMLTAVARNRWNLSAVFKFCFCFVLLYNKSLNDWSLGEQWILFPLNLNVSRDEVEGNIEIRGKQNSLFPKGPVIKWFVIYQNKAKAKFENPVEIPAITCNSGQHFAGSSELFPVWRHSFRNVAHSWHLAGKSFIVRCHVIMN